MAMVTGTGRLRKPGVSGTPLVAGQPFGYVPEQPSILEYRRTVPQQPTTASPASLNIPTNNPAAAASAWAREQGIPYWEALRQIGRVSQDTTVKDTAAAKDRKLVEQIAARNRRASQAWYRRQKEAGRA